MVILASILHQELNPVVSGPIGNNEFKINRHKHVGKIYVNMIDDGFDNVY